MRQKRSPFFAGIPGLNIEVIHDKPLVNGKYVDPSEGEIDGFSPFQFYNSKLRLSIVLKDEKIEIPLTPSDIAHPDLTYEL